MKKLYVLVFLIMFMGKIFSSTTIQESSQKEETFTVPSIAYYDNSNQYIFKKNGDVTITLPSNAYETITSGGGTIGGGSGSGSRKESITTKTTLNPKIETAIREKLKLYKDSFYELNEFFKANSIKMPTLTLSDLKGNPWDTIATRVFAETFGLKKSSLTSRVGGFSNWIREAILQGTPLTLEQRFMIRLQKALIEKISRMTNAIELMEPLKALLLANSKIPAEFGKKSITEIFGSIKNADVKKNVMLKIMEQLKSVKIERDGNIGDRENTLAELVLENIKDVNMRRALVEVAIKSLGTLSQRNNKSYEVESKYEHLLETLINKPDMPFNKDFELKILFTVSNGNRSAIVNQKIQDIATVTVEDIYSPPLQEGLTVTPPVTAFEDMA